MSYMGFLDLKPFWFVDYLISDLGSEIYFFLKKCMFLLYLSKMFVCG